MTDERGEPVVGAVVRALAQIRIAGLPKLAAGPIRDDGRPGTLSDCASPGRRLLVYVPNVQMTVPADTPAGLLGGLTPQLAAASEAGGQPLPPPDPTVLLNETTRLMVSKYPVPPPSVDGKARVYPTTFAGGATSIDQAELIELPAASERAGADIRLLPVAAAHVHGRLDGLRSAPDQRVVRLVRSGFEELGLGNEAAIALVRSDGSFTFGAVAAGLYTLEALMSVNEYHARRLGTGFLGIQSAPAGVCRRHRSAPWRHDVRQRRLGAAGSTGRRTSAASPERQLTHRQPLPLMGRRGRLSFSVCAPYRLCAAAPSSIWIQITRSPPRRCATSPWIRRTAASGSARRGCSAAQAESSRSPYLPSTYVVRTSDPALMIKAVRCDSRDCTDSGSTSATRMSRTSSSLSPTRSRQSPAPFAIARAPRSPGPCWRFRRTPISG